MSVTGAPVPSTVPRQMHMSSLTTTLVRTTVSAVVSLSSRTTLAGSRVPGCPAPPGERVLDHCCARRQHHAHAHGCHGRSGRPEHGLLGALSSRMRRHRTEQMVPISRQSCHDGIQAGGCGLEHVDPVWSNGPNLALRHGEDFDGCLVAGLLAQGSVGRRTVWRKLRQDHRRALGCCLRQTRTGDPRRQAHHARHSKQPLAQHDFPFLVAGEPPLASAPDHRENAAPASPSSSCSPNGMGARSGEPMQRLLGDAARTSSCPASRRVLWLRARRRPGTHHRRAGPCG